MKNLNIAHNLTLPLDAVTQTFAILAKRGVGKTHTGSVMAEEMLKLGQPIVVYDPTGAWWGLKSSADGKRPASPSSSSAASTRTCRWRSRPARRSPA
jgi:DNA helicase HerA-like ATPase